MAAAETALIKTVLTVGLSGTVGYVLYNIISVKGTASTANDYARKWLSWMVFICTLTTLPNFFKHFNVESFMRWIIIVVVYGLAAFAAGWIYGKIFIKIQDRKPNYQTAPKIDPPDVRANNNFDLEHKLYEQIWREIEENKTDVGLWAKCFATCDGDENKTKALYVNKRVLVLKENLQKQLLDQEREARVHKQAEEASTESRDVHSSDSKRNIEQLLCYKQHHWSDDHRTHKKTLTCSKCGDIHHGEGFEECENCGENLAS